MRWNVICGIFGAQKSLRNSCGCSHFELNIPHSVSHYVECVNRYIYIHHRIFIHEKLGHGGRMMYMKKKSLTTFYLSLFRIEGNIMISPPQFVLPRVWAGWRMLALVSSWELWLMNCQEETEGLFVCRLKLYFLPDFTFGLSQYRNITFINGVNLNQNKLRLSSFDKSKKVILNLERII